MNSAECSQILWSPAMHACSTVDPFNGMINQHGVHSYNVKNLKAISHLVQIKSQR